VQDKNKIEMINVVKLKAENKVWPCNLLEVFITSQVKRMYARTTLFSICISV